MPATPVASGRFGVTATSMTGSSSPAYCAYATPTGASSGNSITPSWSSLSSSSAAEHSMPFDSTPRMTPLASVSFLPGIYVPTAENTPFMPVRAFGAPQTTCTGPWPASTMQTFSRSAGGCCLASSTEATTKPSYLRAGSSTDSTSSPTRVSVSTISASEAEVSRWSLSQERVNFIADQFTQCQICLARSCSTRLGNRLLGPWRFRSPQHARDANVLVNFWPMDSER